MRFGCPCPVGAVIGDNCSSPGQDSLTYYRGMTSAAIGKGAIKIGNLAFAGCGLCRRGQQRIPFGSNSSLMHPIVLQTTASRHGWKQAAEFGGNLDWAMKAHLPPEPRAGLFYRTAAVGIHAANRRMFGQRKSMNGRDFSLECVDHMGWGWAFFSRGPAGRVRPGARF